MSATAIERAAPHDMVGEQRDRHVIEFAPAHRLRMNQLGIWLFIISESFLFSGILVARIVLLRDDGGFTRPELDQVLGLGITSILLLSSFFVSFGEEAS